jgi:CrcB protein
MNWILVFFGGGLGSVARYGISQLIKGWYDGNWPWATFISNVLACLALIILFLILPPSEKKDTPLYTFIAIGFCGGFSTFSSFSYESSLLIQNGNTGIAFLNMFVSVAVGVGILYFFSIRR